MKYRRALIEIFLFFLFGSVCITEESVPKVSQEELEKKESAFEEIEYINKAADLTRNHPLAKHIVEGDIMTKDGDQAVTEKKMVIRDDLRIWRTRRIPFVISSELEDSNAIIKSAIDEISQKTCLKFEERKTEENFLRFVKKNGCWSLMGMQNGGQEISIGEFCNRKEIIQHEVLHALGLFHEQSREDRDEYIKIIWENIRQENRKNFGKGKPGLLSTLGLTYDIESLMHYGKTAFGDGIATMESIKDPKEPLGNKNGISEGDAKKLNLLYKCKSIPDADYGPAKIWSDCEYKVKRLYRVCYGKNCDGPNNNGIQHIRMKCDESEQAIMIGCFMHKPSSPSRLQYQEFASKESCVQLHNQQPTPFVSAFAFLECMKHAKRSGNKIFGITNVCKCHYGDDDIDINSNGQSGSCGDGHGTYDDAIFMYKIKI